MVLLCCKKVISFLTKSFLYKKNSIPFGDRHYFIVSIQGTACPQIRVFIMYHSDLDLTRANVSLFLCSLYVVLYTSPFGSLFHKSIYFFFCSFFSQSNIFKPMRTTAILRNSRFLFYRYLCMKKVKAPQHRGA